MSKLSPITIFALFVFGAGIPVFFLRWLFIKSRNKVVAIPQSLPTEGVLIPLFDARLLGPFGDSRFFMRPSSPLLPKLLLFDRDFQVSSYVKFTGTKRTPYQEIESAEIDWVDFVPIGSQWIAIHLRLRDRKNFYSIWMNEGNAKNLLAFLLTKSVKVTEK